MSTLPMQGSFGTRAKQVERQRLAASFLRKQGIEALANQPEGSYTKGGPGNAMFGAIPQIYVPPANEQYVLPWMQQQLAAFQDMQTDKTDNANEEQSRQQAQEAYKNFPSLQATRTSPAITLPQGQAGPVMSASEETYTRSPKEYQQVLTQFGASLDPSNPYMGDMQGKVLEKSMALAGEVAKQDAALKIKQEARVNAQADPTSWKEFTLSHNIAGMTEEEVSTAYLDYLKFYRGTSAQKNAQAIDQPVGSVLEYDKAGAKAVRIDAAKKRVEDASPALYQEAANMGLSGQAAADHVTQRKQQLLGVEMDDIQQQFTLGGGQPTPQPTTPPAESMANRNNNPLNLTDVKTGGMRQFATPQEGFAAAGAQLDLNAQRGLNTVSGHISRWSPAAGAGNSQASTDNYIKHVSSALGVGPNDPIDISNPAIKQKMVTAMAEFEGYKQPTLPLSVKGNRAVLPSTPTASVLPLSNGRAAIPSVDPVRAEKDKTIANNTAEAAVKARLTLPKLQDGLAQAKKAVKDITNMPGFDSIGTVRGAIGRAITSWTGIGTEAGDINNAVKQTMSLAMGPAYETLRGTGSIATAEGEAATAAYNRMNTATTASEFKAAMDDFITNYEKALAQQTKIAAGAGTETTAPASSRTVKWGEL